MLSSIPGDRASFPNPFVMHSEPDFPHSELGAAPAHSPLSPQSVPHRCSKRRLCKPRREVFQTSRYKACSLGPLTPFGNADAQDRTESQSLWTLPFLSKAHVPSLTSRRSLTLDECLQLGTWQDGIAPTRASERRDHKPGGTERLLRGCCCLRRGSSLQQQAQPDRPG